MSGEEDSVLTPQVYAGSHRVPAHDTLEYADGVNISVDDIDRLDSLVEAWFPLPDVAEILGISVTKVQRLIEDFHLVEVRRGTPKVRSVPAEFLRDGASFRTCEARSCFSTTSISPTTRSSSGCLPMMPLCPAGLSTICEAGSVARCAGAPSRSAFSRSFRARSERLHSCGNGAQRSVRASFRTSESRSSHDSFEVSDESSFAITSRASSSR